VDEHKGLLTGVGPDVIEDLLLGVVERVDAGLAARAPRRLAMRDGRLADIAPTLLELMGLPQPAEMTGVSLLRP